MTKFVEMKGEGKFSKPGSKKEKKIVSMSSAPSFPKKVVDVVKKKLNRKKNQKSHAVSIPRSTRRKMLRMSGRENEV